MSNKRHAPSTTTAPPTNKRPRLQPIRRPRLTTVTSLDDVVQSLQSAQRIMVLVGAGISVSSGVPDFRSPNGLYALAQQLGLALNDPQELFDIHFFDDDAGETFYKFASRLWPQDTIQPSPTHHFLSALNTAGRLLRVYTQNIDGLERKAKIPPSRIVECHGTLTTASCRGRGAAHGSGTRKQSSACRAVCAAADLADDVFAHRVPRCKRCGGIWKPDVTFFGEPLVGSVGKTLEQDRGVADLLLVIGTSLQVAPISKVMGWLPQGIPQILINRDVVHPPRATSDGFDVSLIGEADDIVGYLAEAMQVKVGGGVKDGSMSSAIRGPDAVVHRGAVWAPQVAAGVGGSGGGGGGGGGSSSSSGSSGSDSGEGMGKKFVQAAVDLINKDAADEVSVETVTCDACGGVVVGSAEVWTCKVCFGFDLCGDCHQNGGGEAGKHAAVKGVSHCFVREER